MYDAKFVAWLHAIWGDGFLSPGGPEEVSEIVSEQPLEGARLLDLGCGSGGPATVLAGRFGAHVIAADLEPDLLTAVEARAGAAGLSDRIQTAQITAGALPFETASFDIVFSKDSLIHAPDKAAAFAEIFRVLKPGGRFAASDWLASATAGEEPTMARYLEASHLKFALATPEQSAKALETVGFVDVRTRDRNAWYADLVADEVRRLEGPLRDGIVAAAGEDAYNRWMSSRRALAGAVASGALRPTHLFGRKP